MTVPYDVTYVPISKRSRRRTGKSKTVRFPAEDSLLIEEVEKLFEKTYSSADLLVKVVDIRTVFKI
jgi:hypothetical protein